MACNMGGMGFIENNKALCMISVLINTHLLLASRDNKVGKFFFSSMTFDLFERSFAAIIYP
jgi:GDP-D-mannose 3',5'-epimerase